MTITLVRSLIALVLVAAHVPAGYSQEESPAVDSPAGTRRAVVLCGLAGDAAHRQQFADSLELLCAGLTQHYGFAAENVAVHWGDEPNEKDGPAVKSSRGVLTRESLEATLQTLAGQLQPADALWVFVLGHTHYDGRHSWLNIAGTDLHQTDFARLTTGLKCREQAFFITTAASGFYLKALGQPGRIVIAATEPDLEVNETIFPHKLCRAIGSPPPYAELDVDRDWRLTLVDLYLWTARETAQEYATAELLATEHPLLDDTGDGRGAELQTGYLPEELGGKLRASDPWPARPTGDGSLAATIELTHLPSPPVPNLAAAE